MKNKNIFIIVGVVVIVLIAFFAGQSNVLAPSSDKTEGQDSASEKTGTSTSMSTSSKTNQTPKTVYKPGAMKALSGNGTASKLPEIDFIDKKVVLPLKDFPDVKLTINRVVFGRGETVISTGCTGIPNGNFSTYLYPGSGICISNSQVDGSPRGIVAFHILVENNGNIGFGGNPNTLTLQYLRSDSTGKPSSRFAHPLMGIESYYINGYSSREIILSYLVPEDQMVLNLIAGYKEPSVENKTLNIFDLSSDGLQVDFGLKTIKVVK